MINTDPEYPHQFPYYDCLDHGFVALVDTFGTDESFVQAARVSYGKGTKTVREDKALINYLLRRRHTTPFEMAEMKFFCRMPMFVARQWIRHRTANVNEYSGRYSEMKPLFHVPFPGAIAMQSEKNHQSRKELDTNEWYQGLRKSLGESEGNAERLAHLDKQWAHINMVEVLPTQREFKLRGLLSQVEDTPMNSWRFNARKLIGDSNKHSYYDYQRLLDQGVAKELARVVLPLSTYTEWYWKIDVHNLLHFLKLRLDSHAQAEIRVYAEAIAKFVEDKFPLTWEVFQEMNAGCFLTGKEREAILGQLHHCPVSPGETIGDRIQDTLAADGFSERRITEFRDKMGI